MSFEEILLFLACAFIAEVIGTMAGFGAATILTPIAVLFMDIKSAIAIVACFHLFGNSSRVFLFRQSINKKIWLQFGLIAICFSVIGAFLSAYLPSAVIILAFGVFLLIYVGFSVFAAERIRLKPKPTTLLGGGVLSGFIAGLIGTGGAVRSACLMVFGLTKEAYIGTSASIALVVDAARIPVYVAGGFITSDKVPVLCSLIAVAFAGSWTGKRLVKKISTKVFHRFVLTMLGLMGIKLFMDGLNAILAR